MEGWAKIYERAPISSTLLEADLAFRESVELDSGGGHRLLTGKVDWQLPVLIGKVAANFEVLADALDHLDVDVVQHGAAGGQSGGCDGASGTPGRDGLGG